MSHIDFSSLNAFDYVVFTIVGLSTLFAFFRGFIHTVLSFLAWIGSIFVAVYLFPVVQPVVADHVEHEIVANILAFMGVYFVSLIIITIVNYQILAIVSRSRLGAIDRSLGFAFGLARGCVLVTIMFMVITFFFSVFGMRESEAENSKPKLPEWLANAQTYEPLRVGSATLTNMVPKDFWKDAKEYTQMFNKPATSKLWRPEMDKAMSGIMAQLPEETRKSLLEKYNVEHWGDVPVEDRKAISGDILESYKQSMASGEVKGDIPVFALNYLERIMKEAQPTEAELEELKTLFANPAAQGNGGKVMQDIREK